MKNSERTNSRIKPVQTREIRIREDFGKNPDNDRNDLAVWSNERNIWAHRIKNQLRLIDNWYRDTLKPFRSCLLNFPIPQFGRGLDTRPTLSFFLRVPVLRLAWPDLPVRSYYDDDVSQARWFSHLGSIVRVHEDARSFTLPSNGLVCVCAFKYCMGIGQWQYMWLWITRKEFKCRCMTCIVILFPLNSSALLE